MSVLKVKTLKTILDGVWVFIVAWWKTKFAVAYTHTAKMIHLWTERDGQLSRGMSIFRVLSLSL